MLSTAMRTVLSDYSQYPRWLFSWDSHPSHIHGFLLRWPKKGLYRVHIADEPSMVGWDKQRVDCPGAAVQFGDELNDQ